MSMVSHQALRPCEMKQVLSYRASGLDVSKSLEEVKSPISFHGQNRPTPLIKPSDKDK